MSLKVVVSRTRALFDRAGAWCTEKPMKVYAGIYIAGDALFGANPAGHWLWTAAAGLSIFANINKVCFGMGGDPVDPATFRLTKEGLARTTEEMFLSPIRLFSRESRQEIKQSIKDIKLKHLVTKVRRSKAFWRYPLDAGWLMYTCVGMGYAVDSLLSSPVRWGDTAVGLWGAMGSLYGFLTDRNKVVGQMFGCLSLYILCKGLVTANPAFVGASFVYLYGNLAQGQADSAKQSRHTIGQHRHNLA